MAESASIAQFDRPGPLRVGRWFATALWNWLAIGLSYVILAKLGWPAAIWFLPIALVVIGTRQHALALLAHDGAHFLCSRNRALNDVLATVLCAFPLTASLRSYRRFHMVHHQNVGTPEDPEFEYKRGMAPRWDLPATRPQIYRQFAKDCLGLGLPDIVQTVKTLKPIDRRDAMYLAAFWSTVVAALFLTGYLWCLAVWFVALNTVQWAVFRVRTWTEHAGLGVGETHRLRATWWQRFVFLPTNTWCHYEHHESAATPFYELPSLRRRLPNTPKALSLGELFDRFATMPPCPSGQAPASVTSPTVQVWLDGVAPLSDADAKDIRRQR
jgi:fatty acid desaturase